jgi:hypothetical protein
MTAIDAKDLHDGAIISPLGACNSIILQVMVCLILF